MARPDNMLPASFRGVPFNVRDSQGEIGRRTVVNQYPGRDQAYVEDTGMKTRVFTLTAFVLGNDYMAKRDALEKAFEQSGPGELVHPWRGRMVVAVTDCRPSETVEEGGKQSWSVTFTQTGENLNPNIRPDTYAIVDVAANQAIDASEAAFSDEFSIESLPDFVEQDALGRINGVIDQTVAIAKGMIPDTSILPAFIQQAGGVLGKVTGLLRLPTNLATSITGQIAGLLGLGSSPLAAFRALAKLFGYGKTTSISNRSTPARAQLAANAQAVNDLTRRTAIIEAARASASINYESLDQAVEIRDAVVSAIDDESLTAGDDVYHTLTDLKVAVIRDINSRSADLAKVVDYTPTATTPALVLAYSIYGDASKDAEIIARNKIVHPGFVPGGQPIKVLVNG